MMLSRTTMLVSIFVTVFCVTCGDGHDIPRLTRKQRAAIPVPTAWEDWNALAQSALADALKLQTLNTNVAKNVILFLGDGMGLSTVTAGRIYAGQLRNQSGEEFKLAFDMFPHVALSKTYNVDRQTPDSAGTATAYLCGEKSNIGVIGVSQHVAEGQCNMMSPENNVASILQWSLNEGKRAGVVTTTRITHATPAASYAHSAHRDWEADSNIPLEDRDNPACRDIASQLVINNTNINVILGGGRQMFLPNTTADPEYLSQYGQRTDNTDLIQEWQDKQKALGRQYSYVWNQTGFDDVNPDTTDYLLGLFEPSHMQYTLERSPVPNEPTLAQMTEKAIKILSRGSNGYFLLVEGGRIDLAHHSSNPKLALAEVNSFNDAITLAVDVTSEEDTLIVVTADHSHVFTMGGYPSRGRNILGLTDDVPGVNNIALDGLPFLTLMYANGPGPHTRIDLTNVDTTATNFTTPSHIPLGYESHGGEDVGIYALGPMAHLFHGVQEQNYIAHAMAYASCVGQNKGHCEETSGTTSGTNTSGTTRLLTSWTGLVWASLQLLFIGSYVVYT